MNLPYNTHISNLRRVATSEFSRTDNRGIPYSHVQHKITSMNEQTTTPQISMHDCCEDEENDEDSDEIERAPKINTYKEVNEYLEEAQHFLES